MRLFISIIVFAVIVSIALVIDEVFFLMGSPRDFPEQLIFIILFFVIYKDIGEILEKRRGS